MADTIGAGDTVTAAVVDALWGLGVVGAGSPRRPARAASPDVDSVLEHAGRAAAITVSRPGGDPPWRHASSAEPVRPAESRPGRGR